MRVFVAGAWGALGVQLEPDLTIQPVLTPLCRPLPPSPQRQRTCQPVTRRADPLYVNATTTRTPSDIAPSLGRDLSPVRPEPGEGLGQSAAVASALGDEVDELAPLGGERGRSPLALPQHRRDHVVETQAGQSFVNGPKAGPANR